MLSAHSESQLNLRIGDIVDGKYQLVRLLGSGSFGEVYEARHLTIQRRVAIKFLLPSVASLPEAVRRFQNEARAAGEVKHENIIDVFDIGVSREGVNYLVMEHCEGRDCESVLLSLGRLPVARAVDIAVQVCRGLAITHARNIVHRDLKPANLFLTTRADGSELVKILDFGVAKLHAANESRVRTQAGIWIGTPNYAAPEQAAGELDVDLRADIYAVGVILYELLSGRTPFSDAPSDVALFVRIQGETPPPLETLTSDLYPGLSALIGRALAKRRDERFESASAFASELTACATAAAAGARASSPVRLPQPPSMRRRVGVATATLSVVALVALRFVAQEGSAAATRTISNAATKTADTSPRSESLQVNSRTTALEPTIVKDQKTGLAWQRRLPAAYDGCIEHVTCTWEEATRYCAHLALEGGDWRLPNKDELLSLFANHEAFPNAPQGGFWSSSLHVVRAWRGAWGVKFDSGYAFRSELEVQNRVRCVRSEAAGPLTKDGSL